MYFFYHKILIQLWEIVQLIENVQLNIQINIIYYLYIIICCFITYYIFKRLSFHGEFIYITENLTALSAYIVFGYARSMDAACVYSISAQCCVSYKPVICFAHQKILVVSTS